MDYMEITLCCELSELYSSVWPNDLLAVASDLKAAA